MKRLIENDPNFKGVLSVVTAKTDDVVTNVVKRRTLGQSANIGVYTGLGKPRQLDSSTQGRIAITSDADPHIIGAIIH